MALNVNLGGMTFKLALLSDEKPPSFFSVKYSPRDDEGERDAVVELTDFSGTLHISKSDGFYHLVKQSKRKLLNFTNEAKDETSSENPKENNLKVMKGKQQNTMDADIDIKDKTLIKPEKIKEEPENQENVKDLNLLKFKEMEMDLERQESETEMEVYRGIYQSNSNTTLNKQKNKSGRRIFTESDRSMDTISEQEEYYDSSSKPPNVMTSKQKTVTCRRRKFDRRSMYKEIHDKSNSAACHSIPQSESTSSVKSRVNLHLMCGMENVLIKKLEDALKSNPSAASIRDEDGKLPLHIITENDKLAFGWKQKLVQLFVNQLIKTFPEGVATNDFNHRIPFTTTIFKWISELHSDSEMEIEKSCSSMLEFNTNLNENRIIKGVNIPVMVEWCFKMLSKQFVAKEYCVHHYESMRQLDRATLLLRFDDPLMENFCSLPFLLKTVLLIEEDSKRIQILELPIFKKAMLNPKLIDVWLVCMLCSETKSKRVIDFIELLSDLTINEAFDIYRRARSEEKQRFIEKRNAVVNRIATMNGIMPALANLEQQELERACGTIVVQQIIDVYMVLPGVTYHYLLNLSMSLLLMLSFNLFIDLKCDKMEFKNIIISPCPLIIFICVMLLMTDELLNFVMARKSKELRKKIIKSYFNISKLSKLVSVISVMGVTIQLMVQEQLPSIWVLTVVKLLSWIPIFHALKGINQSLASFVFALGAMARSLVWCLLIFFLVIAIFANAMSFIFRNSGECSGDYLEDPVHVDFCSEAAGKSFVRAYSLIIGDFNVESYNGTVLTTMLFFGYSMVGIIFFLNVIIAVVTRSYEESKTQQNRLVGVYRIPFLAKINLLQGNMKNANRLLCTICFTLILLLQFCLFSYFYTWSYEDSIELDSRKRSTLTYWLSILVTVILDFSLVIIIVAYKKNVTGMDEPEISSHRRASEVIWNRKSWGEIFLRQSSLSSTILAPNASVSTNQDAACFKFEYISYILHAFSYWLFGIQEMKAKKYETNKLDSIESLCQHLLLNTKQLVDDSEFRILSQLDRLQLKSN